MTSRARWLCILAVAACRSAPSAPSAPPEIEAAPSVAPAAPVAAEPMTTFELSGFQLSGAEYWPYTGTAEIDYPAAVLWGFYPEAGVVPPGETDPNAATARPAAVACARTAYDALRAFLSTPPAALRRIIELGELSGDVVPRFYLWVNDYTAAADPYPPGVRPAKFWYWKRKQPDPPRPPGYWKWEATLNQHGRCDVPAAAQIETYLAEMLAEREQAMKTLGAEHRAHDRKP